MRRSARGGAKIDSFNEFVKRRGPEVNWNAVVLYQELSTLNLLETYQQVQRFVQPYRSQSRWQQPATVRFETGPSEQAQVDFRGTKLWVGEQIERVHLVCLYTGLLPQDFLPSYKHSG